MSEHPPFAGPGRPWRSARRFAAAFAAFAGPRGWVAIGLVAAGALLEGLGLVLLAPILGVVVSPGDGGRLQAFADNLLTVVGARTPFGKLALLLAVFVGLMVLRAAVLYARDVTLAALQTGFVEDQRNGVIRRLARASWARVAALRHARVANLMSGEVQRIGAAAQFMIQGGVALAMLAIQGALAVLLAPALAAAAAALLLAAGAVLALTVGRARDSGGQVGRASLALMTSATGFMGGLKAALAQNAQAGFVAEFEAIQADMRFHQLAFVRRQARSRGIFVTLSAMAGAAVVLVGYDLLAVEPAVLITLVLVFTRMSGPVLTLYQAAQQFFFGLPAFEAVRALEADLDDVQARPVTTVRPPPEGPLTLTAVRFLHPGGGGIVEASLTLSQGEFLGLTGASGAGKTTLLDLMVGLLPPQAGEITVGGAPLDEAGLAGWRDAVAYVAQDPFLFHDTVRRNLTWGDDLVDDALLLSALRDVGAEAMVSRLEQGLDTVVGERGARLSGGERQRLAIARALLRRPRLLVLDEATNAIDLPGEADLLARLATLDPRPAMVMIAHRPESLAHCDRVVAVEAGRLVERPAPTAVA